MPFDFHTDVRAILCQDPDAICKLFCSASLAVPEDPCRIFSLAWKRPNAITKRNFSAASKADALEYVCIFEKTASASLHGWIPENIDMVRLCDEVGASLEHPTTNLMALREQFFGKVTVQSEPHMLKTHLLVSRISESYRFRTPKPLRYIFCRSLTHVLGLRPSQNKKICFRGRLRWHG